MRTTFRRQVTLIVSLLLAATILLGVSFWGLFTHYVIRERESSLRGTAQSVVWLMQTSAVSDDVTTSWDFLRTLSVTSSASGNDILLCDVHGEVKLCAQDIQGCSHIGYRLPADKVEALFNGESPDLNDEATEIYGQRRVAVALAGSTADGERQGIVLVSVERETISEVTSGALKIFMLTALAVFAVALLATPFLTHRETKPIQDMAAAARQIAHGNLNVRVSTNCQTEEMEELAVAFNNMAAAMQNADTARQEFVANVSHELKTPMTTIAGYLDGMLDGTIPQPEQRHYMELVSTEVRRLSRLVRNMLEISRLKDQGIPADKLADFDLCEAAGQVLGSCIDHVGSYVSYQTVPELGFAIPISEAKTILDDLIVNGYVSGRVSLGLTVSEIPETYRRFWGLPSGVVIESVTAGSNAYYAGLHAGDVICQLGDSAVTNLNDYRSILSACHVGEELRVYIYRDGRQYYTDVTLTGKGESPSEIATEQMQNETE